MLKRNAERELPPLTANNGIILSRLLFRRRERLADRQLVIFYFDGVIGDLQTRSGAIGSFRIRQGALA
jgi:hypothetical protein